MPPEPALELTNGIGIPEESARMRGNNRLLGLRFWHRPTDLCCVADHNASSGLLAVAFFIAAPFAFYGVQVARRRRQQVGFKLRRIAVGMALYVGVIGVLLKAGFSPLEAISFGFLSALAGAPLFVSPPKRDRRIPSSVRRAVIARDLKGERFDSRLHHIDHIVPFSKGGDHSTENLRVLSRSRNLQKAARMPRLKDLL